MGDALKKVLLYLQTKVGPTTAAEGAAARVTAAAHKADSAWAKIGGTLATVLGAAAIRNQVNAVVDAADANRKMAESLGVGVEWLQRLNYAADLSGASVEEASKGVLYLNKNAAAGAPAFAELGVALKGSDGQLRSADALLGDVSDRFAAMPAGPRKTALAMELFGKSGAKLIPLLDSGAAGLAAMGAEADALGLVLGEKAARDAEAYNDAMTRAKGVFKGVRNQLVVSLLPALTKAAEGLARWAMQADRVKRIAAVVGKVVAALGAAFAARKLITGAQTFVSLVRMIGNAGALASVKLALLAGLLAIIALVLEDLYVFSQGGDSLLGRFLGDTDAKPLRKALGDLGQAFRAAMAKIKPTALEALRKALKWLADNAESIAAGVAGAIVAAIEVVKFLADAFEVTGTAIGIAAAWLVIKWGEAVDWLAVAIADVVAWFEGAAASVAGFFAGIWDGLASAATWLGGAFMTTVAAVVAGVVGLRDAAVGAAQAVLDFLLGIGEGVGNFISDSINALVDELRAIILSLPSEIVPQGAMDWALEGKQVESGLVKTFAAGMKAPTANVGAVNVSVQGSADMSAPGMSDAVKQGVSDALADIFGSTLADLGAE